MANEETIQRLWDTLLKAKPINRVHRSRNLWVGKIGQCIRRSFYELENYPPDELETSVGEENPIANLVMDFGNQFESLIEKRAIFAAKDGVAYRGKAYADDIRLDVSGETDPVVEWEGHTIVIEAKATHRDHYRVVFNQFKKGIIDKQYYDQIEGYIHLIPEVDFGVIIVGNRDMRYNEKGKDTDMPPVLLMPVERDMEWKKVNWQRIQTLNKARETGLAPDREFTFDSFQCKYCPYQKRSWESALLDLQLNNGGEPD